MYIYMYIICVYIYVCILYIYMYIVYMYIVCIYIYTCMMCVCTYLHGLLKAQYWNKWELIGIANPFMKAPLNICGVKKWGKWGWFHTTMGMFSRTCW